MDGTTKTSDDAPTAPADGPSAVVPVAGAAAASSTAPDVAITMVRPVAQAGPADAAQAGAPAPAQGRHPAVLAPAGYVREIAQKKRKATLAQKKALKAERVERLQVALQYRRFMMRLYPRPPKEPPVISSVMTRRQTALAAISAAIAVAAAIAAAEAAGRIDVADADQDEAEAADPVDADNQDEAAAADDADDAASSSDVEATA